MTTIIRIYRQSSTGHERNEGLDVDDLRSLQGEQALTHIEVEGRVGFWSNQELAEFYRVKNIFAQLNLPVILDLGVSDEGDPWLVFCNHSGDVFAHFCRIDQDYYLDSPGIEEPIIARNLRDLVDGFTQQQTSAKKKSDELNNKVVILHPSILLAATVLALYFEIGSDHSYAANSSMDTQISSQDGDIIDVSMIAALDQSSAQKSHDVITHAELQGAPIVEKNSSASNFYTLSAIIGISTHFSSSDQALAKVIDVAIMGDGTITEQTRHSNTKAAADNLPEDLSRFDRQKSFEHFDNSSVSSSAPYIAVIDQRSNEKILSINSSNDLNIKNILDELDTLLSSTTVDLSKFEMARPAYAEALQNVDQEKNFDLNFGEVKKSLLGSLLGLTSTKRDVNFVETNGLADLLSKLSKIMNFEKVIDYSQVENNFSSQTKDGQIISVITPKFDQSLISIDPLAAINEHISTPDLSEMSVYNDQVSMLINFILTKGDKIDIVSLPKELLFVDLDALDSQPELVTAKSWITSDHGVISVIGYSKDFGGFHIV